MDFFKRFNASDIMEHDPLYTTLLGYGLVVAAWLTVGGVFLMISGPYLNWAYIGPQVHEFVDGMVDVYNPFRDVH